MLDTSEAVYQFAQMQVTTRDSAEACQGLDPCEAMYEFAQIQSGDRSVQDRNVQYHKHHVMDQMEALRELALLGRIL